MSRFSHAVTGRRVSRTLWMAGALVGGISCSGDDIAQPTRPGSPSEAGPALATQALHPTLTFIQVSTGTGMIGAHSCGVTTTNLIYCWGSNSSGELGNGEFGYETRPVAVASGIQFRSVSAGYFHTCAVAMDQRAYCWGEGATGALGDGTTGALEDPGTTARRPKPVLVAGGLRFLHVDAGHSHTCGLTTTNRVYCWGDNSYGQLGDGTTTSRLRPVPVAGGRSFRHMSASVGHTCAVTTTYQAFCWGSGQNGRLGNGSTQSSLRPVAVSSTLTFRQISAGYYHTCAMSRGNRPYCWGDNSTGQLGNGEQVERRRPTAVAGGRTVEHVNSGVYHTCGNGYDGQAYCWGYNGHGRLGRGTDVSTGDYLGLTPGVVIGGLSFKQLSAGGVHSCGITTAGKAYCWGNNWSGQLGDGTTEQRLVPTAVAGPA